MLGGHPGPACSTKSEQERQRLLLAAGRGALQFVLNAGIQGMFLGAPEMEEVCSHASSSLEESWRDLRAPDSCLRFLCTPAS